ncbi:MAG: hypothetical protein CBC35_10910 [Planctomycetes bacterium TMED75]|nr:hypothetical protein [Planctomycetaceae bacterium]OUU90762.1 MAG: hypothetical protein CBC35_10910 [Planctomycetes bacterium TMED75]
MRRRLSGITRRGSSLLLVTTAMGAAVILSGAYLASRANGALVGANLSSSSLARIQVESALGITHAALTGSGSWRSDHNNGLYLFQESEDSMLRVQLLDLATDRPPDQETVDVRANITADQGGIIRYAQADFFVPLDEQVQSIDVDLGEFALFAGDSIQLGSEAVVQGWSASPGIGRGDPLRVGTSTGSSMGIQVNDSATIIGGVEYRSTGSSGGSSGIPIDLLPDNVVIHQPAPPAEDYSETLVDELSDVVEGELRIMELELRNGDQLEFEEGLFLRVEGDLLMRNGSVIDVRGNCSLVVEGNLSIQGGQIRVEEGSELTVHVGGDLDLRDAKITEPEGTEDTWVPKIDRVSFVTAALRENIPCWRIRGSTLFKGELYAPSAEVVIEQRAVVIGRVAAQRIRMSGYARMLYDPTLDNRNGYTAADQRLYQRDGQVLEQVRKLESLAPEELLKASLEIGVPVTAGDLTARVPNPQVEQDQAADRHRWWSRFSEARERGRERRQRWRSHFNELKRNSSMTIRGIGMNAHQFGADR